MFKENDRKKLQDYITRPIEFDFISKKDRLTSQLKDLICCPFGV